MTHLLDTLIPQETSPRRSQLDSSFLAVYRRRLVVLPRPARRGDPPLRR